MEVKSYPSAGLDAGMRQAPLTGMIHSFRCAEIQRLFETGMSRRLSSIARFALRKPDQLDNVTLLRSLAIPPGNHLETLKGVRLGQFSIRINQQW